MIRSISRRTVFAASGLLALVPTSFARAQYVETAIAVAKAVYSAYQSIQAARTQQQLGATVGQINLKLDLVIRNQDRILSELSDLKIAVNYLPQSIDLKDLVSAKDRFDGWVAAGYPGPRSSIASQYNALQVIVSNLSQDEFPVFSAFMAGMSMLFVLSFHGRMQAEFQSLKKDLRPRVALWLDPNNPKSISALISNSKTVIAQRVAALEGGHLYPDVTHDTFRSNGDTCNEYKDLRVQISMSSPANATLVKGTQECHFNPNSPEARNR